MILPLVLGLGVFYLYPIGRVFFDSFYDVGAFNRRSFAGMANYIRMVQDPMVWTSLRNTLVYVAVIVPGTMIISLMVAVLLNTGIKGKALFRVIYFLPAITMGAAVSIISQSWRMRPGLMGVAGSPPLPESYFPL